VIAAAGTGQGDERLEERCRRTHSRYKTTQA
jgi:hypothetical protein